MGIVSKLFSSSEGARKKNEGNKLWNQLKTHRWLQIVVPILVSMTICSVTLNAVYGTTYGKAIELFHQSEQRVYNYGSQVSPRLDFSNVLLNLTAVETIGDYSQLPLDFNSNTAPTNFSKYLGRTLVFSSQPSDVFLTCIMTIAYVTRNATHEVFGDSTCSFYRTFGGQLTCSRAKCCEASAFSRCCQTCSLFSSTQLPLTIN